MYRQYSSRNQRNRGIKVKHAVQICVFLAICFWLIYQMKHSHDQKKEFEESDANDPLDSGSEGGLIKIGRKDIRPLYQAVVTGNEQRHNEAAEEEETTEIENIHEEDRSSDEKVEEDNKASRDGDDDTDEHEIEKSDKEVDQEDEHGIEKLDKEVDPEDEHGIEKSDKEVDPEDEHVIEKSDKEVDQEEDIITDEVVKDGIDIETEGESRKREDSADDRDLDGGDESNHDAREELYKEDDNHTQTTENESEFVRISGHLREGILELENNGANENNLENSKDSYLNNSLPEASNDDLAASNSTTDVTTQNPKLSEQNMTETVPELDHDQGIVAESTSAEGSNFKTVALEQVDNYLSYSNLTDPTESIKSESNLDDFSKPSNDTDSFTETDSFTVLRITRSEHSMEDVVSTKE